MISGDLQELEAIFHAARERGPDEVASYLDTACGGDERLRASAEMLLESHRQAADFIETAPVALATWAVKSDTTNTPVGRTIGHYKVIEFLSRGGMGEAYLALDTKGERKAVLKLLPARFTASAARVSRFQLEARAVIALNHPNIVTIYEIGEEDSTYYIASELIEGETLRHRLVRGRMPLPEVVEIGVQIASALTAAHKAGVVHRDIKPENIMLRDDGYVKVLDFGIAKLAQPDFLEPSFNEQRTATPETTFGSAIGTLRYMSPEQVRGEQVDARTDIWSLGVVLYEMAAGVMPFVGQTVEETSRAIQHAAPAKLSGQRTRLITDLQQMIFRALQKDRVQRYASMGAMLESLKQLRRRTETEAQPSSRWRMPLALAAAFVALAAIFVVTRNQINERVATQPRKSIAVLPFENKGPQENDLYFSEAIEKELIGELSTIGDVFSKERPVPYGTNLLVNGDAEEGQASSKAEPVPVPGWKTTGAFTVVPYGAPDGYPAVVDTPPSGMKQFFAGGRSDVSTAAQEIDLSANANDIDTGRVTCDASAWLGGYSGQEDSAKLTVEFRSNTAVNLKSITLGPVTALERSNQTGLRYRSSSLPVPAQTRRIHAELILTRKSDAGPWNDGYADNLSLILHGLDQNNQPSH